MNTWVPPIVVTSGNNLNLPINEYSPGSYNLIIPSGITKILVNIQGGGGGGGGGSSFIPPSTAGGGGAGGYIRSLILEVTPGDNIQIQVGSGGLGAGPPIV